MKNDDFGNRMKEYEHANRLQYTGRLPVYMRLDGRSFSKFVKKLVRLGLVTRPRDEQFRKIFTQATLDVCNEFRLQFAFHQSDEISLLFPILENELSMLPFNGKVDKLLSVVTSKFTSCFITHFVNMYGWDNIHQVIPDINFDARICELPSKAEATNMIIWRFQDGYRNEIQDIAHFQFGAKALHKVSTREKHVMIGNTPVTGGNFITRVIENLSDANGNTFVRHRYADQPVDFYSMSFDDRMEFIWQPSN